MHKHNAEETDELAEEVAASERTPARNYSPTGLGDWTLFNARWVDSPTVMRSEVANRSFRRELAQYQGSKEFAQ